MKLKFTFILVIVSILYGYSLQANGQKIYQTEKLLTSPPMIDGRLDDPAWNQGYWAGDFVQFDPFNNAKPSQDTRFKILYDDNNIYVAIRAFDSAPDSIDKRITRRDIMGGDLVAIGFDSYFDKRTAFIFFVNAAGVKTDLIQSNDGGNEDSSWDAVWHVKTSVDNEGWVAEMQIPLDQLRFAKVDEHQWGLQVGRTIFRKLETNFWQHIPKDAPGFVSFFGLLNGLKEISPKKIAELSPYSVAQTETFLKQADNPFADGNKSLITAGLDGKFGITNDLTLTFTVNPDFGQVEADPSEVNLTAFETYFEEKRPFFIEGRNIFNFTLTPGDGDLASQNLFYSRRIGRIPQFRPSLSDNQYIDIPGSTSILGAIKLSGKTKSGWSVGILQSLTGREYAEIDNLGSRQFKTVEPLTNYFVGRVQKDINNGNTIIGGMLTATNRNLNDSSLFFLHRSAYSGGLDFNHFWKDKTYSIGIKAFFSHVSGEAEALLRTQTSSVRYFQRPDATHLSVDPTRKSLSGHGGTIEFAKIGHGQFNFGTFINWKSPGLEINDIGFLRSTDEIMQVLWAGYRIWEPFSVFRNINFNYAQWHLFDFSGKNITNGLNVNLSTQFKNFWSFSSGVNYEGNSISTKLLRGGPAIKLPGGINNFFSISTDYRKKIMLAAGGSNYWSKKDYLRNLRYWFSLSYRPFDAMSLSLRPSYSHTQTELQYVGKRTVANNPRYIFANMDQKTYSLTLRINYSLTPELSIQYYGAPFISTGNFSNFKYITNPMSDIYTDRFARYSSSQISFMTAENRYYIDENIVGIADFNFHNPDFNSLQLNSNLVARWEYRPGSVIFLVWSQGRNQFESNGDFNLNRDYADMFDIHPHNIFLIKFSYRFGL